MDEKRPVNWVEIEKRYCSDEPPVQIARDYRDLTSRQIQQKAYREGWKREKKRIKESVPQQVLEQVEGYKSDAITAREKALKKLVSSEDALEPLYYGKTKANPYTLHVFKQTLSELKEGEGDNTKPPVDPKDLNPLEAIEAIKRITQE
jgi:hypothetical protein